MAALRFAARRLGGQRLQAPVAVVEEAQRRLLPRLFDGRSRSTSSAAGYEPPTSNGGSQGLSVNEARRLESRLWEILDRTEELYNLTAEVQKKYSVPGKEGRQLRWLSYDLSELVDPRPDDNEWRWLRGIKRLSTYGGHALSGVAAYFIGDILADGTKNMPGMEKRRMEQRKSREGYLV